MKIVTAATDFSKNGNNAIEYAAGIAGEFHSRLLIVHVYENTGKSDSGNETESELKKESQMKLDVLAERFGKEYNIKVETHLLSGENTPETIVNFATRTQSELLVSGSTGNNFLERLVIGSITSKLIRLSNCPLLCVPANASFKTLKKIAFATDLKDENINSSLSLVTFAKHFDAEICFLFVDDKDLVHDEKTINEITSRIRNRVHYSKMSGYVTKHTDIIKGLQNFINKLDVQIIALFTHLNETEASLTNSVTAKLSEHTKIPLLVLKRGTVSISE